MGQAVCVDGYRPRAWHQTLVWRGHKQIGSQPCGASSLVGKTYPPTCFPGQKKKKSCQQINHFQLNLSVKGKKRMQLGNGTGDKEGRGERYRQGKRQAWKPEVGKRKA